MSSVVKTNSITYHFKDLSGIRVEVSESRQGPSSDKEIDPRDYWDLFDKLSELFPNDGEEQLHTKVEKFFKKRD